MELNDRLRWLDIDDLIFLAMKLDGQSFETIARKLNITQSAVSIRKTKIEYYLEIEIFTRNGQGLKLTEQGERFAKSCRYSLMSLNAGSREFQPIV